ncbi:MAG TPA: hypothetical protein VHG92_01580 [Afifellaceae bacterium]|nr:hypothetical protein [Afifellaceae bacterium]
MSTDTLPVPLNQRLNERLKRLAAETDRNEGELAVQAIEDFLAVQDWQVGGIKKAEASMDRGAGVCHGRVTDWVQSWGAEVKKPPK